MCARHRTFAERVEFNQLDAHGINAAQSRKRCPIEADHIVGFMLGWAREYGIDDTMLTVAYAHLKAHEGR